MNDINNSDNDINNDVEFSDTPCQVPDTWQILFYYHNGDRF